MINSNLLSLYVSIGNYSFREYTTASANNCIYARERHKTALSGLKTWGIEPSHFTDFGYETLTIHHIHIRAIRFDGSVTHIRPVSFSLFTTDFPAVCPHFNRKRIKIYRCLSIYTSCSTHESKEHSANPFNAHTHTPKLPVTTDDGTNKHPHTHDRQRRRSKLHFSLLYEYHRLTLTAAYLFSCIKK